MSCVSAHPYSGHELEIVFKIIFELLGKAAHAADMLTRVRASILLARAVVHNVTILATSPSFPNLWLQVVGQLAKDIQAGGTLGEAVLEHFKNTMLVMLTQGVFERASEISQQNILEHTWAVLNSFIPSFKGTIEQLVSGKNASTKPPTQPTDAVTRTTTHHEPPAPSPVDAATSRVQSTRAQVLSNLRS